MIKQLLIASTLLFILLANSSLMAEDVKKDNYTTAILHTSKGDITIKLFPEQAPISVQNFIDYAKSGFYDKTIFHRVKKRFVIQGGGFTEELEHKEGHDPIVNEAGNGLHNDRWTVAMARTDEPDSATSQFYINLRMNSSLDKRGENAGYAVFGEVIDGKYVAQDISKQRTEKVAGFNNLPLESIFIESVELR
ncbi:MAG: cyclophilin family peptidyl-prolyl cis-trans isomerase [Pseudohongiellaceae bacterium]|jgi:cyclophilin family peptidyl-prolyl cis-trans isomerase